MVQALIKLALVSMTHADYVRATAFLQESLNVASELSDNASAASSLNLLGQIQYVCRQLVEARTLLERSVELRRAEGDRWGRAQALCDLGLVVHAEGSEAAARAMHAEGLAIWRELSDEWGLAYALEGFALLFGTSNPERAVQLVVVATGARGRVGIRRLPGRETNVQETLRACGQALGDEAYAAAWTAGRALSLEVAVQEVLETIGV